MANIILKQIIEHWQQLRGRTYDFLDQIKDEDLPKKLPFPESQSIYYQLTCMLGTTETFVDYLKAGQWEEWHCSLPTNATGIPVVTIRKHLEESDKHLLAILAGSKLLEPQEDKTSPLEKYLTLVEHESHHHGQLINFIYALHLPIPKSWADQWALKR
jgi:uncharacterized damage-inducible protein DinB